MCEQDSCGVRDKLSNRDDVTMADDLSLSDSDPEEEPASVPFDPEVIDLSDSEDEEEEDEEEDDSDDDGLQICGAERDGPASGPGQREVPPAVTQSPFSLKGGTSDFSNRSRSIFDSLDTAAKLASSQLGQDNVIDGVFARPPPPPPLAPAGGKKPGERPPPSGGGGGGGGGGQVEKGRGGVPDYVVHPERWTCYNLEDVAETSDGQNSAVAHQYIQSLQQRKDREAAGPEADEPFVPTFNQGQTDGGSSPPQHKIIFSRPSRAEKDPVVVAAVDQKAAGGTERGKGLSHLEEDEEEEEEGKRPAAADKGLDLSKGVKKAKESEGGVVRAAEEEEEDGPVVITPPQAKQRKRKWGQSGRAEGAEQEEKKPQANTGFVSFRKINRKNYRRTSEREED